MPRYVRTWQITRLMMIVDTNHTDKDFGIIVRELEQVGESIGVIIKCQKEEIFNQMHRI